MRRLFFKTSQKDRRKFVRLRAHHLLKYRVVGQQEYQLSFARNISAGGLLFYAPEEIPTQSILEIIINFPSYPKPIKVRAKPVRVHRLEKVGGYEIGVEFIEIDEATRNFINRRVLKAYSMAKGGGVMNLFAVTFLLLAVAGGIIGFIVRFCGISVAVAPLGWISLTNMFLLLSIAISVLIIAHKK
ncbi:MAG: PilZ domain-containing protein [Candidatus Omnitrophota bacterium]|nr:MAG: PilZ domain-containing protein [Candidatus Omnitrophota bacterium]